MTEIAQNRTNISESHRYDWQKNQDAIERVILQSIEKGEPWPSQKEIEVATGLSRRTICAHANSSTLTKLREHTRVYGSAVLEAQARRAIKTGDHNEAKTYFKLNYDWKEPVGDQTLNVNHNLLGIDISEIQTEEQAQEARAKIASGELRLMGTRLMPVQNAEFTDEPDSEGTIVP